MINPCSVSVSMRAGGRGLSRSKYTTGGAVTPEQFRVLITGSDNWDWLY